MNSDKNKRRKRQQRNRRVLLTTILIYLFLILLLVATLSVIAVKMKHRDPQSLTDETEIVPPILAPLIDWLSDEPETEHIFHGPNQPQSEGTDVDEPSGTVLTASDLHLEEEDIYTFLQGPKAWASRTDWSGTWNSRVYADQEFSVFGCGLCALANIYSTLTPYDCSPIDMLEFAKASTDYAPVSGYGAIDWPYMKQTLKKVGITSKLKRKDASYEAFRDNIASGIAAITLVCSSNDDTYWQGVSGHYVTIWLYNKKDETVFLSDSGNPSHNRQRIPLRYVYDALKTSNRYQYQLITAVDPQANTWQHDGISIKWKKPRYYNH